MKEHGNFTVAQTELINWLTFAEMRETLGPHFARLLGYFREDGTKSVAAIEQALQQKDSSKIVIPAHTLKGEAAQFGADRLSLLAEEIEITSRHFVEIHQDPSELVEKIAEMRPLFEESLSLLEAEASPLVKRQPASFEPRRAAFGRRC